MCSHRYLLVVEDAAEESWREEDHLQPNVAHAVHAYKNNR